MDTEFDQWNIADAQFSLWLKGEGYNEKISITRILKSAYFVFRQKQRERLAIICQQSFDDFKKREEDRLADLLKEPVTQYISRDPEYNDVRFCKVSKPGHYERLTKEKNEKIINGILSGSQMVFNELYENEFPKVVRLITKNSGSVDLAKDIFQDGLIILIEKVNRMELDLMCSVVTYLYSICRLLWLEQLRKRKKNISLDDSYSHSESDLTIIVHDTESPDIYEAVNNEIEKLGKPCRQLLEGYYYRNMSWDEIASELGYKNAASARNQKYKYLEKIRSTIGLGVE
ncbi:MAG: sigma-70 family RNA polymerase sigma factor [Mariniphaga sp.]